MVDSEYIVVIYFGTWSIDQKYNIIKQKRTVHSADLIVAANGSRFTHESRHFLSLRIVKGQYLKLLRFQVRCFSCMLVLYPPRTIFYPPRTFLAGVKRRFGWSAVNNKKKGNKTSAHIKAARYHVIKKKICPQADFFNYLRKDSRKLLLRFYVTRRNETYL